MNLRFFFENSLLRFLGSINEPLYSLFTKIGNFYRLNFKEKEKVCCFGKNNPDKTFYIITNLPGGLGAQYDCVLGYLNYAYNKNYTPIIDLSITTKDNIIDSGRKEKNPWNYYFEQPYDIDNNRYDLDDVYSSKNVIFCTDLITIYTRYNKKNIRRRFLLSKKIDFTCEIQSYLDKTLEEVLSNLGQAPVAVCYRGTDYFPHEGWNLAGNPKVAHIAKFCDLIDPYLIKWNGSGIFFMTEDNDAFRYFIKRYENANLGYIKRERFTADYDKSIGLPYQHLKNESRYEMNKKYLADLYIFSKCQYAIGPFTSGFRTALNWNNCQYKDVHIIDLGKN